MIKPITPKEAEDIGNMPDEVISAFNTLIAEGFNPSTGVSEVDQDDAIYQITCNFYKSQGKEITRVLIFDHEYLKIENIYRRAGWEVTYNNFGGNDGGTFIFSRK